MPDEDIQGLTGLLTKLGNFESLVTQKTIVARSVRAGCDVILARMRERAPDDPDSPGTHLRDSLMRSVQEQTATEAIGRVGPSSKTGWYAKWIEFGATGHALTAVHAQVMVNRDTGVIIGTKADHPGVKAKPFIRPAWDETINEAQRVMGETLAREIEEEGRR